jgi:hypothetical protein
MHMNQKRLTYGIKEGERKMKKILTVIIIGLLCFSMFSILAPKVNASSSFAPDVVCVPFNGQLAGVPHDAWIGKEIILKGTAHDKDGDGTMVAYKWDFGDGYSTDWISSVNPYIIEAKHTYTGTMADGTPYSAGKYFTAWLYVKDNDGLEGKDSYFIAIREKTLDVEVNVAIDNGLWWLHKQQSRGTYGDEAEYGYWPSSYGFNVAFAGACTEAFELQGHLPSGDRNEDPYVETVQRGLNYLFSNCGTYNIGQDPTYCPFGNPDTNGNGIGLACTTYSGEILYEAGIALMAISSSGTPDRVAATGSPNVVGRTYKDIAQDMVDWIAWGQSDPYTGVYEGGWRYTANYGASDNSVSQWPVIGMEAAERNFGMSGLTIPSFVRPELLKWLAYSQGGDGGFGYQSPGSWENTAKTGAGCAMLYWTGIPTTDAKFQNALSFLNAHWYDSASTYTNFGDYYTMYAIMKGMRIPHPNIESIGAHDWYAEYARYIIDQQNSYGGEYVVDQSWLSSYVDGTLATAWAIATLTPTLVKPGPVADAGSDVNNFPPTIPAKFDASGSYHRDPTKSIVLYEWDFESDGTWDYSGTDVKVEHAYPAYYNPDGSIDWDKTAKDYTATLRVTDNSDPVLQDTDTCIIHITAPPWKPVADPDGPYEGYVGAPIQLDGSKSYDPESKMYPPGHPWYETIAKYEWDLNNDGKFDDSVDVKPSYTWNSAGTYSVGLKVTDSQPSGPGGTIGPLDIDIKYTTVVISTQIQRFNPSINGFGFDNYAIDSGCKVLSLLQIIQGWQNKGMPKLETPYVVLVGLYALYAYWLHGGGHCYGISHAAVEYYDHPEFLPSGYTCAHDIMTRDESSIVQNKIEDLHSAQLLDWQDVATNLIYNLIKGENPTVLQLEIASIKATLDQGRPDFVDMHAWWMKDGKRNEGWHSVVAYDYSTVGTETWLKFYDSNGANHGFADHDRTMKFGPDDIGTYGILDDGDTLVNFNIVYPAQNPSLPVTLDTIKENIGLLVDWLKDNLSELWGTIKQFAAEARDLFIEFVNWLAENAKDVWAKLIQVKLFSHAQLNLYNSEGLHVGLTPDGNLDQEFNGMFLASDTMQLCVLPNPETGAYKVKLVGVSAGSYTLSLESIAQGVVVKEELITKEISEGDIHEYNLWLTPTGDFILDNTSPTTSLDIGDPKYTSGTTYVTPDTPFTLAAMDTGSGVKSTAYRINSTSYDSGWLTYTKPFNLTSLHDGNYTIGFNSTDNVGNVETTHEVSVTLFSWNYVYQDTYGRGTTLKINLAHKFIQFITPNKDYGIRKATCMKQCGRAIIIEYCDKQLRLITVSVDTKIDFCYAMAWDLQTRKCYLLIDKAGIE